MPPFTTVKTYDTYESCEARVLLVGGGNGIRIKTGRRVGSVRTLKDVVEPASLETTRYFTHGQKMPKGKAKPRGGGRFRGISKRSSKRECEKPRAVTSR